MENPLAKAYQHLHASAKALQESMHQLAESEDDTSEMQEDISAIEEIVTDLATEIYEYAQDMGSLNLEEMGGGGCGCPYCSYHHTTSYQDTAPMVDHPANMTLGGGHHGDADMSGNYDTHYDMGAGDMDPFDGVVPSQDYDQRISQRAMDPDYPYFDY